MHRAWLLTLLFSTSQSWAQTSLSYTGGIVRQDFDSLPRAETDWDLSDVGIAKGPMALTAAPLLAGSTMAGWRIHARVGTQLQFLINEGSRATASVYSYGHHAAGDRALGSLAGSDQAALLGWRILNSTGQTLSQFTLSFYAEQWRNGGTTLLDGILAEYRITSTSTSDIDTGTYTLVPALNITPQTAVAGGTAVDGNSAAYRTERSATVTGLSWAPGQILILRWRDIDETGADNGLAMDDLLFHASGLGTASAAPAAPILRAGRDSSRVLPVQALELAWDQPVTLTAAGIEVRLPDQSPVPITISHSSPLRSVITPQTSWPAGTTLTLHLPSNAAQNTAGQSLASAVDYSFTTQPLPPALTPISSVQGTDGRSALTGSSVRVRGIVIADFQGAAPALGGYSLQAEVPDLDASSSEAIWVSDQSLAVPVPVSLGDVVEVTGTVAETGGLTQLTNVSNTTILGTASVPAPVSISLPTSSSIQLEEQESMRITLPQSLSVTLNSGSGAALDAYSRYGQLTLSSGGPLITPTQTLDPNDSPATGTTSSGESHVPAIHEAERQFPLRSIILDDGTDLIWPEPMPYLNAQQTRRCGDEVTGLTGLLHSVGNAYRIQPTQSVAFQDTNPRPITPPSITGRLRIASMNVLNYFITFGGANDRGADNSTEFTRQRDKIISALTALDADVLCVIEIQNSAAAQADLLSQLNAALPAAKRYSWVPDPAGGYPAAGVSGDYIRCGMLYRSSTVSLWNACQMDTHSIWSSPTPLRYPLAQVFQELSTQERFLLCINHWKSKSSTNATGLNRDQNDGQSSFNDTRKQQATQLATWLQSLATQTGESDVLVLGDLNSNPEEDPLDILRSQGFSDQITRYHPSGAYSYSFNNQRGTLDHAFATSTAASQVLSSAHWAINADEPSFFDYNTESKTPTQLLINTGTPYRSSDHDPLLLGLSLSPQPTTYNQWVASQSWQPGADTQAAADPDQDHVSNLMEYVLHTPPSVASPGLLPTASYTPDAVHFDYRQRIGLSGVTLTPQWSSDLQHWFPLSAGTPHSAPDFQTQILRITVAPSTAPRLFFRLQVQ